jgi:AraC-like DNA-binding protein
MTTARRTSSRHVFTARDFPLPGLVLFGRFQHAVSSPALGPHAHAGEMEICFLERGEQTFRVKGRSHRLRGHDQFFTLPDEVHDTAELPEERGTLYWLILNLKRSRKFLGLSGRSALELQRQLLRMPTRHFRAHPGCARLLARLTDLLLERRRHPRTFAPYHELRLQSLLLEYLTLSVAASHQGAQGTASPLMRRVLHHIERHLGDPVHVPRLVQVARLSESRFKSRFKAEIGVPPAEYWLRQKIERATGLLRTHRVTEVAHALGFSSSQYFATAFKRYTLASPSRFRPAASRESARKTPRVR